MTDQWQVYPGNTYSLSSRSLALDRAQVQWSLMKCRYDYYPYNDTVGTEVFDNLYVRMLSVLFPFFGPKLESWEMSGECLLLKHVPRLSLHPYIGNTDSEKGARQLCRPM